MWFRRFLVHGVFWRQLLRLAVLSVPPWIEPLILGFWALFFLLWGPGRRGVMRNLGAILPGSWPIANFFRTYRVFWNFAATIADATRFKERRVSPDWTFTGIEHFNNLQSRAEGAIILTAHMGSYDIGAQLFAEVSKRPIVMVRAPESDPDTRRFEEEMNGRTAAAGLRIDFSTGAGELALDLLHALQRGETIAIQGDRVTASVASIRSTLFGRPILLPAGPFALSMAARVPIYPLFVIRRARRRYELVVGRPFTVTRTRDRAEAFEKGVATWTADLEHIVRSAWFQWFTFESYSAEEAV